VAGFQSTLASRAAGAADFEENSGEYPPSTARLVDVCRDRPTLRSRPYKLWGLNRMLLYHSRRLRPSDAGRRWIQTRRRPSLLGTSYHKGQAELDHRLLAQQQCLHRLKSHGVVVSIGEVPAAVPKASLVREQIRHGEVINAHMGRDQDVKRSLYSMARCRHFSDLVDGCLPAHAWQSAWDCVQRQHCRAEFASKRMRTRVAFARLHRRRKLRCRVRSLRLAVVLRKAWHRSEAQL